MMLLIGQLNNSIAEQGSPGPRGVVLICNKARFVSALVMNPFLKGSLTKITFPPVHCFDGDMMMISFALC